MRVIIKAQRTILLDVQGSNVWSGQQVQVRAYENIRVYNLVSVLIHYLVIQQRRNLMGCSWR